MAGGAPSKLTRQTSKKSIRANRRAALKGKSKGPPGTSLDEYPFASSTAGGSSARVAPIPAAEQNKQGGKMSAFYQKHSVGNGQSFTVKVV